jgi:peptidoglycan-associated lipoprotein
LKRHRTDCITRTYGRRKARASLAGVLAFVSLDVLGCATVNPPPARSADAPTLPAPPPTEARYLRVALAADLDRCETESPHFFYDVDVPRPQDQSELLALATCLQSEPYRGLKLLLVGRADHRGDTDYNESLAMRRAEHVAEVLATRGVDKARLKVMSRGEADAIGHTEESIASLGYDRRVDIFVVNPVSPGHPAQPVHQPNSRQ